MELVRTGLQGLKVYLFPDVSGLTVKRFLEILLDAMSQLSFFLKCFLWELWLLYGFLGSEMMWI